MNFWVILYRFSWVTLGLLVAIAIFFMFWPRYQQYKEYQRRGIQLQEEKKLEEEMIQMLKRKQEQFASDPRFVERLSHEMGLARPDEIIFKFVDDPPQTAPARP